MGCKRRSGATGFTQNEQLAGLSAHSEAVSCDHWKRHWVRFHAQRNRTVTLKGCCDKIFSNGGGSKNGSHKNLHFGNIWTHISKHKESKKKKSALGEKGRARGSIGSFFKRKTPDSPQVGHGEEKRAAVDVHPPPLPNRNVSQTCNNSTGHDNNANDRPVESSSNNSNSSNNNSNSSNNSKTGNSNSTQPTASNALVSSSGNLDGSASVPCPGLLPCVAGFPSDMIRDFPILMYGEAKMPFWMTIGPDGAVALHRLNWAQPNCRCTTTCWRRAP